MYTKRSYGCFKLTMVAIRGTRAVIKIMIEGLIGECNSPGLSTDVAGAYVQLMTYASVRRGSAYTSLVPLNLLQRQHWAHPGRKRWVDHGG